MSESHEWPPLVAHIYMHTLPGVQSLVVWPCAIGATLSCMSQLAGSFETPAFISSFSYLHTLLAKISQTPNANIYIDLIKFAFSYSRGGELRMQGIHHLQITQPSLVSLRGWSHHILNESACLTCIQIPRIHSLESKHRKNCWAYDNAFCFCKFAV